MSKVEIQLRAKLANNGRTAANDRAGIRVGSNLHLAEMILAERDELLSLVKRFAAALGTDETLQGGERVGLSERARINGVALNEALIDAKEAIAKSEVAS